MSEKEKHQLVAEVNILRELDHENIVRYFDRFVGGIGVSGHFSNLSFQIAKTRPFTSSWNTAMVCSSIRFVMNDPLQAEILLH